MIHYHDGMSGPAEEKSARRILVSELAEYIGAHYSDPALSLKKLGEVFHFHPNYLSYTFKEYTGEGFSRYLSGIRLRRAGELLRATAIPVGTIAEQVGYRDAFYFERVFKRDTGLTPSEYRSKEGRKNNDGFDPFTRKFYR